MGSSQGDANHARAAWTRPGPPLISADGHMVTGLCHRAQAARAPGSPAPDPWENLRGRASAGPPGTSEEGGACLPGLPPALPLPPPAPNIRAGVTETFCRRLCMGSGVSACWLPWCPPGTGLFGEKPEQHPHPRALLLWGWRRAAGQRAPSVGTRQPSPVPAGGAVLAQKLSTRLREGGWAGSWVPPGHRALASELAPPTTPRGSPGYCLRMNHLQRRAIPLKTAGRPAALTRGDRAHPRAVRTLCQARWHRRAPRRPPPAGLQDPRHKQHAGSRTGAGGAGRRHHTGTLLGLSRKPSLWPCRQHSARDAPAGQGGHRLATRPLHSGPVLGGAEVRTPQAPTCGSVVGPPHPSP